MPAPPNNRNALKHGLYSRRINSDQSIQLVKVQPLDVEHEISVLRAIIDNILGEIEGSDDLDQKARLYNSLFTQVQRTFKVRCTWLQVIKIQILLDLIRQITPA